MSAQHLLDRLKADLRRAEELGMTADEVLNGSLRYLAKWRSQVMAETILQRDGVTIQSGPFAGMRYVRQAAEGSLAARLLGIYEAELHPHLAAFKAEGVRTIIDIGCAEGYYAVGLARSMPEATVHAFDIDPVARAGCAELAAANGVSDRVVIGELFQGERFADYDADTLVIADIEGAEADLLDPGRFPGLCRLKLIVETHPGARPGVTETLIGRFAPTHDVIRVDQALNGGPLPNWLVEKGSHLDLLISAWEWRHTPTPWLVMRPKG